VHTIPKQRKTLAVNGHRFKQGVSNRVTDNVLSFQDMAPNLATPPLSSWWLDYLLVAKLTYRKNSLAI